MVFASYTFLFWFLPLFLATYFLLPGRGRNLLLVLASYLFYSWARVDYVGLLFASTAVDYLVALRMGAPVAATGSQRRRFGLLLVSLGANLGLLGYFKYANLLVETAAILGGQRDAWGFEAIALPVGISFYTFQSLSYSIDVYRGRVLPTRSLLDFACYVSMFPQLVAGPIVRYREVADRLPGRTHSLPVFAAGVHLFMFGFAKKILLADNAVWLADAVFALESSRHVAAPGFLAAWLGILAYSVQIYFDFSGYSDMAIGLGAMLGFRFPRNFDAPYRAASVTETWQRWHITLSRWLRDYLYVALGGNRSGRSRTYVNLFVTMLLGGLWHGAMWTKVLWGAYNGLLLALERALGRRPLYAGLPLGARIALTFVVWLVGLTIFRAESMASLGQVYAGMSGAAGWGTLPPTAMHEGFAYTATAIGLLIAFAAPQAWDIVLRYRVGPMLWANAIFVLALAQLFSRSYSPFIYFQF